VSKKNSNNPTVEEVATDLVFLLKNKNLGYYDFLRIYAENCVKYSCKRSRNWVKFSEKVISLLKEAPIHE